MADQEKILSLMDRSTYYIERAVVLLVPILWHSVILTARELIAVACLALTSAFTILAYCTVYGKDFRGYQRRYGVLYMTERIAVLVLLFMWCTSGQLWGGAYALLVIFFQSSFLFNAKWMLDDFHPSRPGTCSAAKNRISPWGIHKLVRDPWIFEEMVRQGENFSKKDERIRGREQEDAKGDEETENMHSGMAGPKDREWNAKEEVWNGLLEAQGNYSVEHGSEVETKNELHEIEEEPVGRDDDEESSFVVLKEAEEEEADNDEEKEITSRLDGPRGEEVTVREREYLQLLWKQAKELSELKTKHMEELDKMETEHEEELEKMETEHEEELDKIETKHEEEQSDLQKFYETEMSKLDTKYQVELREWETQRQTLLKTIAELEAQDCKGKVCDHCWKQLGEKSMEAMREWKVNWDRCEGRYEVFCAEFRDNIQVIKKRNAYIEEKLTAREEEAGRLMSLLEKSEEKRSALEVQKDELAKWLSWTNSMCVFYRSCMNQLVQEVGQH